MAERGAFLVPTLVTYQQLQAGGAAAGMPPELVAKVGSLVEQVGGCSSRWGRAPGGEAAALRYRTTPACSATLPPQGLNALRLAQERGVTMAFGSDLLGACGLVVCVCVCRSSGGQTFV